MSLFMRLELSMQLSQDKSMCVGLVGGKCGKCSKW